MSWAAICHECTAAVDGDRTEQDADAPPATVYGEGRHHRQTEADAYRKAFHHVRTTGHTAVFVLAGVHYVGDGEMPTEFPQTDPPVEAARDRDVAQRLWQKYPDPLSYVLTNLADRNHDWWLESDVRKDTYGAAEVRRTGLTHNEQEWADALKQILASADADTDVGPTA